MGRRREEWALNRWYLSLARQTWPCLRREASRKPHWFPLLEKRPEEGSQCEASQTHPSRESCSSPPCALSSEEGEPLPGFDFLSVFTLLLVFTIFTPLHLHHLPRPDLPLGLDLPLGPALLSVLPLLLVLYSFLFPFPRTLSPFDKHAQLSPNIKT